ncbi:MAG: hypothetical protein ACTSQI_13245 [Candidatus Helarchaeota archaeon]
MGVWVLPPFGIELVILGGGYLYLILKSSGNVRRSAILIIVGISIILCFWYIHGTIGPSGPYIIPEVAEYLAIISPIAIIIGGIIAAKGFFGYT